MDNDTMTNIAPLVDRKKIADMIQVSPDFFTMFSNFFRVLGSSTEYRLFFGESMADAKDQRHISERICITVTPPQAKSIVSLMSTVIGNMEKKYGAIPTLEDFQQIDAAASQTQTQTES
jgi:hypothetical protein